MVRTRWPHPAFCVVGEADVGAWSRAAALQSQPLLQWATVTGRGGYRVLGKAPTGPDLADVSRVANDLRNMALQRYIVMISPGVFCAVRPVAPPRAAVLVAPPEE